LARSGWYWAVAALRSWLHGHDPLSPYAFDRPLATKETDHGYTEWVAGHYESALASGGGRYDHVDAIISTTSRQPTRVRYRRRLLPFVSLKGKPLVVGYSALSSDLALPL